MFKIAHSNNATQDKNKKRTYILIALVVLFFALGVGGYYYFNQSPPKVVTGLPELDKNISKLNNDDLLKLMQTEVDKDNIRITLKHEIEVDKNGKANVDIRNSWENADNIQVEYYLATNQKKLYVSGLVPPNNGIASVPFENIPNKGEHTVKIYYKMYDKQELINTTTIDGTIIVSWWFKIMGSIDFGVVLVHIDCSFWLMIKEDFFWGRSPLFYGKAAYIFT